MKLRLRLLGLFLALFLVLSARPGPLAGQEQAVEPSPSPAQKAAPPAAAASPSSSSNLVDQESTAEIGPLEEWVPRPQEQPAAAPADKQEQASAVAAEQQLLQEDRELFQQLLNRRRPKENEQPKAPLVHRVILGKEQKRRLQRLFPVYRQTLRRQTAGLRRLSGAAAQDRPEIRLCAASLNRLVVSAGGTPGKGKKTPKQAPAKKQRGKEKAAVQLIAAAGCDAVAFQDLAAGDYREAVRAAKALAKGLEKATNSSWSAHVGQSRNGAPAIGYLVRGGIRVVASSSFMKRPLPHGGSFVEQEFIAGPMLLVLSAPGNDGAPARLIYAINASLATAPGKRAKDGELHRMQMAEAVRRITGEFLKTGQSGGEQPIVVLLADRAGGRFAPATMILEGRRSLRDFDAGQTCSLEEVALENSRAAGEEEHKKGKKAAGKRQAHEAPPSRIIARCNAPASRPKLLFGVAGETADRVLVKRRKTKDVKKFVQSGPSRKKEREMRLERRRAEEEIYLAAEGLRYAKAHPHAAATYAVKTSVFKFGRPHSPLVSLDLNW